MILRKVRFLLFLMLAASVAAWSSETAFETFKGFEGTWAIRSGQKTLQTCKARMRITSRGSFIGSWTIKRSTDRPGNRLEKRQVGGIREIHLDQTRSGKARR